MVYNLARSRSVKLLTNLKIKHLLIPIKYKSTETPSSSKETYAVDPDDKFVLPGPGSVQVEFADDVETIDNEQLIELKRNKSRLLPQHRNMLLEKRPYDEAQSWIHNTEKYQRSLFGKLGLASGVDPRICFPCAEDIEDRREYERVAHPKTLQEMITIVEKEKAEREKIVREREEQIIKKLGKLAQWTKELNEKMEKKESEALIAKERKERLVEEVRRHFGFKLDHRDERFKQLLEQKEKEDKKKQKEAKRKIKEEKMLAKLKELSEQKMAGNDTKKTNPGIG